MKIKYKILISISLAILGIITYLAYEYISTKKQIEVLIDSKLSFLERLERANINSALLVNSQAVDYHPIWDKEDNSRVYVNIMGTWYSFRLNSAIMNPFAQLRGEQVAIVEEVDHEKVATSSQTVFNEIAGKSSKLKRESEEDKVLTKSGLEFEILHTGFSSIMVATAEGSKPKVIWSSDMENCFGLELSKDETLVSYLCEMNGPIIMRTNIDLNRYKYYDKGEINKKAEESMNDMWQDVKGQLK